MTGVTVADQPVLLDHNRQIQDLIDRWLPADYGCAMTRMPWQVDEPPGLPRLPWSPPPRLRLNQLYWPTGATRWAQLSVLVTREAAAAILTDAWQPSEGQGLYSLTTTATPGDEGLVRVQATTVPLRIKHPMLDVTIDMYVADYRQLSTRYDAGDTHTPLVLLRLVDERFYWQTMGFGGNCTSRPATGPPVPLFPSREYGETWWGWLDVFAALFESVHVDDYELDTGYETEAWYQEPDPVEFCRPFEPVGPLLEAACCSIGARLVRDKNGTVRVEKHGTAYDQYHELITDIESVSADLDCPAILGEELRTPGPRGNRLLVAFPRNVQGHVTQDDYYWALLFNSDDDTSPAQGIHYVDQRSELWADLTSTTAYGTLGVTDVVHCTAYAYWDDPDDTAPQNLTTLQSIARGLMARSQGWTARHRGRFWTQRLANLSPWIATGFHDYQLYDLGTEHPRTYRLESSNEPDAPASEVALTSECERHLSTLSVATTEDLRPRRAWIQDRSVPLLPERPYFYVGAQGTPLSPGGSTLATWVIYDETSSTWLDAATEDGSPGLEVTIYDPYHLAYVLPQETVQCEWDDKHERWVVCVPHGLRRHGTVIEAGGISPDASGTVRVYKNDVGTDHTIEAELCWMHMDKSLAQDTEVSCWYNSEEQRWIIDGAEC